MDTLIGRLIWLDGQADKQTDREMDEGINGTSDTWARQTNRTETMKRTK